MTWNPHLVPPPARRPPKPLPRLASETTADNPWPVSLLSEKFYTAVERWPSVWVAGQITQINTRRQGSAYITLRDDQQDIAMEVNGFGRFAAAAAPFVQGDRVIIHGKPNVWMKRTSLSLRGDAIIAAGAGGSLKAMIDELRKKYGDTAEIHPMPSASYTHPNITIKPSPAALDPAASKAHVANPKEVQ